MKHNKGIPLSLAVVLLVCAVVAATLAAGFSVYVPVYNNTITDLASLNTSQAVQQTVRTVDNYIAEMTEAMEIITDACAGDESERSGTVMDLMQMRPDVEAVYLYDSTGAIAEAWTGDNELKETYIRNLSYTEWDGDYPDESIYISTPHVVSVLKDHYPWVVSFMRQISLGDGSRLLAVMDIRFSRIAQYVDKLGIGAHGYCFITDNNGNIVYHPQQQLINSGLKSENNDLIRLQDDGEMVMDGKVYSLRSLDSGNWRIVGVSYLDETAPLKPQQMAFIVIFVFYSVIIAAYLGSLVMTRLVTRPVRELIRAVHEFDGYATDFKFHLYKGSSEILELSSSFESMADRIQKLMAEIRDEEEALKKTRFQALQAQINPHFLYNTLDAISWMCEDGRNAEAAEMINALGKLFRISISKGHELITVRDEVEHARSYLMIQKVRYKDQFAYGFDVQESCLDCLCNKITLQPFIENALYHGINMMVDEGRIDIRIFGEGEDIVFQVEDNGIGMTREQCQAVLKGSDNEEESGTGSSIGIKNVNDRIRIYFGKGYGVSIQSEPDEGTCITVRIPRVEEKSYERRYYRRKESASHKKP